MWKKAKKQSDKQSGKLILKKGNVNECCTALVKNLIKESFYEKRKKSN